VIRICPVLGILLLLSAADVGLTTQAESFLSWSADEAVRIGRSMREDGRVGGFFDFRVIHTEHAYNYKLRATWLTPEVIRASARHQQLRLRLSSDQALALVAEAEAAAHTVIMVEIDPREGSGVIPLDWRAILQPKGTKAEDLGGVEGASNPRFKNLKAMTGVVQRDYSYDVFWMAFPLVDGNGRRTLPDSAREAELIVGIHDKKGTVSWPIPDSIRQRTRALGGTN
jgi:hypothetical protein